MTPVVTVTIAMMMYFIYPIASRNSPRTPNSAFANAGSHSVKISLNIMDKLISNSFI